MRFSNFALGLVAVSAALMAAAPVPSADTTALVQRSGKEQDVSHLQQSSSEGDEDDDSEKGKGSKGSGTHGSSTSKSGSGTGSDDATTSDSDSNMSDSEILEGLSEKQQKAYKAMSPAKQKEFMAKQRATLSSKTGGAASEKKIVCSPKIIQSVKYPTNMN